MLKSYRRYFLILAILIGGMVGYVWERVTSMELSKQIDYLISEKRALEDRNSRLQVEVARLSKSERIGEIAVEKLGMLFPPRGPIVMEIGKGRK